MGLSSNIFTFLKFKLIAVGSSVPGQKIRAPSHALPHPLWGQNPSCPFTILASPFESNTKTPDTVRKVLGKWNMTHSCDMYHKWAQHVQTQMYPVLSGVGFCAYFACLTSDILPHTFPRLSGSNFSIHLQNATNKNMIKKSPFACPKMFKFSPTGENYQKTPKSLVHFFDLVVTRKELARQKIRHFWQTEVYTPTWKKKTHNCPSISTVCPLPNHPFL